jgi:predicted DNA-binding protein
MPYRGDGKQLSIRFPRRIYMLLKEIAQRERRSISFVVNEFLEVSLDGRAAELPPRTGRGTPPAAKAGNG